MSGIRSLAKDTAVYGLSSILGRFLNWLLVPLYVYMFPTAQYGVVSNLYGFTAVALVVLNYGMETGFFRFANKPGADPRRVYTTALWSVGTTSLAFTLLVALFLTPVSRALLVPQYPHFVMMLATTVAIDAFCNIPFARLRDRKRAWRFAMIKIIGIAANIGLNLFFLLLCPVLSRSCPALTDWFYLPAGGEAFGIGWIFVANLISSLIVLGCLVPELTGGRWQFDYPLLRRMLAYSWPLLILGVAGILSQNMGQIIIPYLFPSQESAAHSMVGIYSANMKIAIVMVMFTQAFRYAYEPFIFSRAAASGEDRGTAYCDAMKYFVIFGLLIFLGVMFYLPVLSHFIAPSYRTGLDVVPVLMVAELCFGVFFNLSLWYKLTDRTAWGMYLSLICFAIMLGFNLWLVPAIGIPRGYMGSAWAALVSYASVMILSWLLGRRYYPLPYPVGRMSMYLLVAALLYGAGCLIQWPSAAITYLIRTMLLISYLGAVCLFESIPVVSDPLRRMAGRLIHRRQHP